MPLLLVMDEPGLASERVSDSKEAFSFACVWMWMDQTCAFGGRFPNAKDSSSFFFLVLSFGGVQYTTRVDIPYDTTIAVSMV